MERSPAPVRARCPITLLTGFLGSGKTTLLARWLADPAFADTAVIVNEFGEVAIDHLVVAHLAENMVELRDGCLCCSIRGDLALTLRDLHRRRLLGEIPPYARIVVETTGLAEPVPLLHTLIASEPLRKAFLVDAVVTVVDGELGLATLAAEPTAAAQVALADILVVSKIDRVPVSAVAALATALAARNQAAEVLTVARGEVPAARLLDRRLFEPGRRDEALARWLAAPHDHTDHGSTYAAHVIRHPGPLSLAGTSVMLNRVVNEQAERVLRIKGVAAFREKRGQVAVLHAVQNKFYPVEWLPAWPGDDHDARFVFIGRDLDTARIDELFRSLAV